QLDLRPFRLLGTVEEPQADDSAHHEQEQQRDADQRRTDQTARRLGSPGRAAAVAGRRGPLRLVVFVLVILVEQFGEGARQGEAGGGRREGRRAGEERGAGRGATSVARKLRAT